MKSNFVITIILTVVTVFLTGCAGMNLPQDGNPDFYSRTQTMRTGQVVQGVVLQVRDVSIGSGSTAKSLGAAAGGIAGFALTKGKSTHAKAIGTMIGGVGGSMIGSRVGRSVGEEIVVQLSDNYGTRVLVQEKGKMVLAAGQKVLLLVNGMETRIVSSK